MQNINLIIKILKKRIQELTNILKALSKDVKFKIEESILKKSILFSNFKEKRGIQLSLINILDLASYLIITQVLFYYLYSFFSDKVPQLHSPLKSIGELKSNFDKIQEKGYKLLYSIDILSIISQNDSFYKLINDYIIQLKNSKAELIHQDLLGRLFQECLSNNIRKKNAVFYTRPIAAELLAQLAIDSANEKVIDIACGTGTLLIAAYRRKLELIKMELTNKSLNDQNQIHDLLLENIIGLEIIPFAAYLTSLNLSLQNLNAQSRKMKISIVDSLTVNLKNKFTPISVYIQNFEKYFLKQGKTENSNLALDDTENSNMFLLDKVNVVLINPPFTRKELLSGDIKHETSLRWPSFRKMGYWGYFLLLSDELLEVNGKIAAVIPSGFFRGHDTIDLRYYLFKEKGYRVRYIIKLFKDIAFTESAIHRDFLVILEKEPESQNPLFGMVYLNESIDNLNLEQINKTSNQIKKIPKGENYKDNYFEIKWINHNELLEGINNLWNLVGFSTPKIQENLFNFYKNLLVKGIKTNKFIPFQDIISMNDILRGLEPKPPGLFKAVFLVKPFDARRILRSDLVIENDQGEVLLIRVKNSSNFYSIPKKILKKGLKTHSYLSKLQVTESDYIITEEFSEFQTIRKELQVPEVDFSYILENGGDKIANLFIIRRFGFSEGTKLICFYSKEGLIPSKNFYSVKTDLETAKILALWFNTTFSIIELLLTRRETGGTWGELVEEDLIQYHIPNLDKDEKSHLMKVFDEIKDLDFPSLYQQFKDNFEGRMIIDRAFLEIFGFEKKDIEETLKNLYVYLAQELKNLNNIKK